MKITIITTVFNGMRTIEDALASVRRQILPSGVELEHIVVDGASTDGTQAKIAAFASAQPTSPRYSVRWISEKDNGLYDGLNKGIRLATGDVIGICNADDALAGDDVVARMAAAFGGDDAVDVVYADVRFVKDASGVEALRRAPVMRYCTGRFFRRWMFRFATFPAHPSTFVRRERLVQAGLYSMDYRICADFELMLRLFCKYGARARYLPFCTHVMRSGGLSTDGLKSNIEINREDLRALRANGYWSCLALIYLKYLFKIWGLLRRKK